MGHVKEHRFHGNFEQWSSCSSSQFLAQCLETGGWPLCGGGGGGGVSAHTFGTQVHKVGNAGAWEVANFGKHQHDISVMTKGLCWSA